MISENKKLTFIDLFAGCGGLSEGFYKQDFEALSHVEIDHYACETLKTRMRYYNYEDVDDSVLEIDITSDDIISKIEASIKGKNVDLIIGGPPCQSFSSLGRAKDANGMADDPRNFLFESYVKILNHFNPKLFVFENVTGLLSAKLNGRHIVKTIMKELGQNYNLIKEPKAMVLNSADYGVPQIRKRVIIIGVRKDINLSPNDVYNGIKQTHYDTDVHNETEKEKKKYVTVKDAIGDMPSIKPGGGSDIIEFRPKENNEFLDNIKSKNELILRDHVARTHNENDIQRFELMSRNKWSYEELLRNRPDLNHSKQRVFNNSYAVQWWDLPSKTIIAHLYKDGNQFIHPDYKQGRTITPREAARLQSFPDDFVFEGSRTQQYKQIGNAVPPLFAEAIAKSIKEKLNLLEDNQG
jgi:DNA (cytosine-5)-methyltransferase 1